MQDPSISPGNLPQLSSLSQQRVRRGSQSPKNMSYQQDARPEPENTQSHRNPSMDPHSSPSAAMAPARSNTMSWQQRPSSRGSAATRSRPLSMAVSENTAARSPRASIEPLSGNNTAISRNEIMRSLGAKDPTYFKQTEERGHGSAAFRRNQADVAPESSPVAEAMRLPGMSRETSAEPEKRFSPPVSVRSTSPSIGMYYMAESTIIRGIAHSGTKTSEAQDHQMAFFWRAQTWQMTNSSIADLGISHRRLNSRRLRLGTQILQLSVAFVYKRYTFSIANSKQSTLRTPFVRDEHLTIG